MEVMLKLPAVSGVFHPMQITVDRFLIGGLCLIPFAIASLKKKEVTLTPAHLRYFALTGLLCVPLSMVLFQLSVVYGHANVVAVLFSGNPIFVTFLAFLILRETIHWNNILALLFEVSGIIAIINPFSSNTTVNLLSVGLVIMSALLFSLYSVLGKRMTKTYGGIVVTCFSFLFGSVELFALLVLGHLVPVAHFYHSIGLSIFCDVPFLAGISSATLPYFLFICLINSAAGYVFHMLAMEKTNAHMTNLIFFFKPILAPIIAFLALHEAITSNMVVGIVFFLLGSLSGILPTMLRSRHETALSTPTAK
jgi:drug/metabolite transporter (DMT)-like permease